MKDDEKSKRDGIKGEEEGVARAAVPDTAAISETSDSESRKEDGAACESECVAPEASSNRTRYCSECGTPYLSGAKFCLNCGRNVYNDEVQMQGFIQNATPQESTNAQNGEFQQQQNSSATKNVKNSLTDIVERVKAFPYLTNIFVAALSVILLFTALFAPFSFKSIRVLQDNTFDEATVQYENLATVNQSIYDMMSALTYIDRDIEFYEEVRERNEKILAEMYEELYDVSERPISNELAIKRAEAIQTKYLSRINYYGMLIAEATLHLNSTDYDNDMLYVYIGSSIAGTIVAALMIALAVVSLITGISAVVGIAKKKPYHSQPRIFKTAIDLGLAGVIAMSFMTTVSLTSCAFSVLLTALIFNALFAFVQQLFSRKVGVVVLAKNVGIFVLLMITLCLLCGIIAGVGYDPSIVNLGSAALFYTSIMNILSYVNGVPTASESMLITSTSTMMLLSIVSIALTVGAMSKVIIATNSGKSSADLIVLTALTTAFTLTLMILLSTVRGEIGEPDTMMCYYYLTGTLIAAFVFSLLSLIANVVFAFILKNPKAVQAEVPQS